MLSYTKHSIKQRNSLTPNFQSIAKRKSLFSIEQNEQSIFPYEIQSNYFVENLYSTEQMISEKKCRKSINVSGLNTRKSLNGAMRKSISTFNNDNTILKQQFHFQFINKLPKEYDIWIEYDESDGINGYYMHCIRTDAFQIEIDDQPIMSLVEYNQLQKIEQRRRSIGINIDWDLNLIEENDEKRKKKLITMKGIDTKGNENKIIEKTSKQTSERSPEKTPILLSPQSKSPKSKSPLRSPLSSPRSKVIMTKRVNQHNENNNDTDDLLRIESLDKPKEEKNVSSVSMRKQRMRNTKLNNRMNTVQSLHVDSLNSDLLEEINKMNIALDLTELNTINEFQSINDPSILEAMNTLNALNPKSTSTRRSISNTDIDINFDSIDNNQKEDFKEENHLQHNNEKALHVNGGLYLKDFVNEEIKIVGYSKNGNLIPFDASIQNIIVDRILCSKTTILEFDRIPNIRIKKFDLFDAKSGLLVPENE